jgi:hypothetical protein
LLQYCVGDLPGTIRAQLRHYRLARRHGRQAVADAFTGAAHITDLRARHGFRHDQRMPLIHALNDHNPLTGRRRRPSPSTGRRPIVASMPGHELGQSAPAREPSAAETGLNARSMCRRSLGE